MNIIESYLTNNPCYKMNQNPGSDTRYIEFQRRGPLGLMIHSVGVPQPSASVFVKSWNSSSQNNACVHAFIDANTGDTYQCLPWNYRGWHGGGSSNNTHIGVELCEPNTIKYTGGSTFTDNNPPHTKEAVLRTYNSAVGLFAFLCTKYSLNPLKDGVIISHKEGNYRGIASAHGDPEHIWSKYGLTMEQFRTDINKKLKGSSITEAISSDSPAVSHISFADVRVGDYYNFYGDTQYTSDSSEKPVPAKAERVKITKKSRNSALHPIHARSIDVDGKFITGVYGWVDLEDISELEMEAYLVKVTADSLNIRSGPSTSYEVVGSIVDKGIYTIVETINGWGKLKSKIGWISLNYTKKL